MHLLVGILVIRLGLCITVVDRSMSRTWNSSCMVQRCSELLLAGVGRTLLSRDKLGVKVAERLAFKVPKAVIRDLS